MITPDSRILITGITGQLGYDCYRVLKSKGYNNILACSHAQMDLTKELEVESLIQDYRPEIVIHCAGYTKVDQAEKEKDLVYQINTLGTKYLATSCNKVHSRMIYISTDYVFDGTGDRPIEVNQRKHALSTYGLTKSWGEDCVLSILKESFVLRTSWVFGKNGHNFIRTMLKLADSGKKELSVVSDQIGSPTYSLDLAYFISGIMKSEKYGIYHVTNEGYTSWYEFARYIFEVANKNVTVNPVSTRDYERMIPSQAIRPLNSRLSRKKLVENGFSLLPSWQDATYRYIMNELKKEKE